MVEQESLLKKSNPLRADLRWEFVLIQGVIAVAIGLYALLAEESARNNILFLIGAFLLVNGLMAAVSGIRRGGNDPMAQFRMLRAGIGIATGLIVVLDRLFDFMDINPARVIAGLGLFGIGAVMLIGTVLNWGKIQATTAALVTSLLLAVWGIATIVQAANDSNSSRIVGWAALLIGIGLLALAFVRRQQAMGATGAASPA